MKRTAVAALLTICALGMGACALPGAGGAGNAAPAAAPAAEAPAEAPAAPAPETVPAEAPAAETQAAEAIAADGLISEDRALAAVDNYFKGANPELYAEMAAGSEYPMYLEISSVDDSEVVVVFRSYTGALTFYHVNRTTGDTTITELVPGIIDEEQPTGETFNINDY